MQIGHLAPSIKLWSLRKLTSETWIFNCGAASTVTSMAGVGTINGSSSPLSDEILIGEIGEIGDGTTHAVDDDLGDCTAHDGDGDLCDAGVV